MQFFNYDQANKALVFVRPISSDLQRHWKELSEIKKNVDPREEDIQYKLQQMENCLQELKQVGCECKDIEQALIDFPTLYKGKPVYMCWKLGDESISFWHDPESDYEHRQEITEEFIRLSSALVDPAASLQ